MAKVKWLWHSLVFVGLAIAWAGNMTAMQQVLAFFHGAADYTLLGTAVLLLWFLGVYREQRKTYEKVVLERDHRISDLESENQVLREGRDNLIQRLESEKRGLQVELDDRSKRQTMIALVDRYLLVFTASLALLERMIEVGDSEWTYEIESVLMHVDACHGLLAKLNEHWALRFGGLCDFDPYRGDRKLEIFMLREHIRHLKELKERP